MQLVVGDKAPPIVGATAAGRFYSLDAQAGRPALIVALGSLAPDEALAALEATFAAARRLGPIGIDVIPVAPISPTLAAAFAPCPAAAETVVHLADADLPSARYGDGAAVVALDRSGRVVEASPFESAEALVQAGQRMARTLLAGAGRTCACAAPVLIVPNVLPREGCEALIRHFEASPHEAGCMASLEAGKASHKLDEGQKLRRDIELAPGSAMH
ncbi:MAG: hypothetical protein ACREEW_03140, partial [Caulobacteraceae bacterium]